MKQLVTLLLMIIIMLPPIQVHADIVIYEEANNHVEDILVEDNHSDEHHKNDTEDEKNTEHHHHCLDISTATFFIQNTFFIQLPQIYVSVNNSNFFYKNTSYSSYLEGIFQPPRFS